jgi:hypothetical protein
MAAATRRRYLSVAPAAPLRPFVECLWVHAISDRGPGDDRRILPDGRIDLVWLPELGVLVAGPQSRHTSRPLGAPLLAFGARFHPGAAFRSTRSSPDSRRGSTPGWPARAAPRRRSPRWRRSSWGASTASASPIR